MKVLVTGGTGFVGRRVVELLVEAGHAVRRSLRRPAVPLPGVQDTVVGELDGLTRWTETDLEVDVVIHLAARAHVIRETAVDPHRAFQDVNVRGTQALASAAARARVSRFVLVSSAGVYGFAEADAPHFDETSPVAPHTPYATSKWLAEQALQKVSADTGLPAVSIRPPLVYGPGNGGNMLRLLELIDRNLPLPLGSVRNRRSLIYVDNLASAIIACTLRAGTLSPLYVVRDGHDLSTPELIAGLSRCFTPPRREPWPFPEALLRGMASVLGLRRSAEAMLASLRVRDDLIHSELGWLPPVSVEIGLSNTVNWFQTRGKPR